MKGFDVLSIEEMDFLNELESILGGVFELFEDPTKLPQFFETNYLYGKEETQELLKLSVIIMKVLKNN
jgi:hypothetical protein